MPKIIVNLPGSSATTYPILIRQELLQRPQAWLPKKIKFTDIVIITDHIVKKLYGEILLHSLEKLGQRVFLLSFKAGESSKIQHTKQILEERMLQYGCGKETLCLALGGGVVGDIAGFIAATYMRGIAYIQIPTTLLAMVDSSVGGKTAIDTRFGKNLIGAFWQPVAVIADIRCLRSLHQTQLINGLFEAIKMALTNDKIGFQYIQRQLHRCLSGDEQSLQKIIQRAVNIKSAVVAQDEKEQSGPRMILNFGHTIGHALEKVTDYKILHGYAVAYGILVEAKIAELMKILPSTDYTLIVEILAKLGIHAEDLKPYSVKKIIHATKRDKKNKSGLAHYILLKNIGQVYIDQHTYAHPITDEMVQYAFQQIMED